MSKVPVVSDTSDAIKEDLDEAILKHEPPSLQIRQRKDELPAVAIARTMGSPQVTNGSALVNWSKKTSRSRPQDLASYVEVLHGLSKSVNEGDLKNAEATLTSQAVVLNAMFADLALRAANNVNGGLDYKEASEMYFKMALKAQNQCRMTLETLANIKNPPVVYARQANIANGPQQVNNGHAPPTHAAEQEVSPTKILEQGIEQRMDTGTSREAAASNSALAAVEQGDGT